MQFIKITLLGLICTIIYGILQDQITARLCVEYFTIGHSRIFGDTEDPTLLALGWEVLATWWVGLILGVPLAVVARIGSYPKVDASRLVKPILILMASVGFVALKPELSAIWSAWLGARRSLVIDWLMRCHVRSTLPS